MLRAGGRIVHASPANNWLTHGFYQFSRTCFYDLYGANRYTDFQCYLLEANQTTWKAGSVVNAIRSAVANVAIMLGLSLLLLDVIGLAVSPGVVEQYSRYGTTAIPGYHYPLRDPVALRALLDQPMETFDLDALNNLVFSSLIHSDRRRVLISENWLHWLGGQFYVPFSSTQDPKRIVAGGGGLCGEVAAVLNRIAVINGYPARIVGLNGHVVSEVKTEAGWRIADPDYGIAYPVGLDYLEGEGGPAMMRRALEARGFGRGTIDQYVHFFQSSDDNVVLPIDTASSPRLYRFEVISNWLKWIMEFPGFYGHPDR